MRFFLSRLMVTLALDFEQNGVHLIDEDHGFEDFCE